MEPVNAALLHPIPFRDPEQSVEICAEGKAKGPGPRVGTGKPQSLGELTINHRKGARWIAGSFWP